MVNCAICGELVHITDDFYCIDKMICERVIGGIFSVDSYSIHIDCFNKKIKKLLKYV